jgi:hypothetical protein
MSSEVDRGAACHWMLLRLAGTVPDGLLARCRGWLAQGRHADVARAVTHALLSYRVPVPGPDLDLLDALLTDAGADRSALLLVDIADEEPAPVFTFDPGPAGEPDDSIDATTAAAVAAEPGALALWRSWRVPGDGSPWPPPCRVYLVEIDANDDPVPVTGRLQAALPGTDAAVEVYPTRAELPRYQRLARAYGALIWARTAHREVRVAALFDELEPAADPVGTEPYPLVDDEERDRLVAYLSLGEPVLVAGARMDDLVDPARGAAVPMDIRTDGYFVWSDATRYYLARYGLRPDPALLAHVRGRGYRFPAVDGAAMHRASAAVYASLVDT